jgi:hypothetical protein
MTDAALVLRARGGDRAAYDALRHDLQRQLERNSEQETKIEDLEARLDRHAVEAGA